MHASPAPSPYPTLHRRQCGKRSDRQGHWRSVCSETAPRLPVCAAERRCRCYDLSQRQVPYEKVMRLLLAADGCRLLKFLMALSACWRVRRSELVLIAFRRPGCGSNSWLHMRARGPMTKQPRTMTRCFCYSIAPSTLWVRCRCIAAGRSAVMKSSIDLCPHAHDPTRSTLLCCVPMIGLRQASISSKTSSLRKRRCGQQRGAPAVPSKCPADAALPRGARR